MFRLGRTDILHAVSGSPEILGSSPRETWGLGGLNLKWFDAGFISLGSSLINRFLLSVQQVAGSDAQSSLFLLSHATRLNATFENHN